MPILAAGPAIRCDANVWDEILDGCHADPDRTVTIIGRHHIELEVAFCRRHFSRVVCRSIDGPREADGSADLFVVPDGIGEAELCRTLARHGASISPCGLLVLRMPLRPVSMPFLPSLLAGQGFVLAQGSRRLSDGSMLHVARRQDAMAHIRAA
jgi:hypothetical protein